MSNNKLLSQWLTDVVIEFTNTSPENSLYDDKKEKAWDEPIVGFAQGNDKLFEWLKEHIGLFYWTPEEIFRITFPEKDVSSSSLSVISWILPHTEITKSDNRVQTQLPSDRWARSRYYGEQFNVKLLEHVVSKLQSNGFEAVAPMISPLWAWRDSPTHGLVSNWSERHVAYVCGLGTFGLSDGLITPLGKAIRCGSVVANLSVETTLRKYSDHHEYCLYYAKGTCKRCAERCPAGAITEQGHDKKKCGKYTSLIQKEYAQQKYGIPAIGCGLCQTDVPCESKIPL